MQDDFIYDDGWNRRGLHEMLPQIQDTSTQQIVQHTNAGASVSGGAMGNGQGAQGAVIDDFGSQFLPSAGPTLNLGMQEPDKVNKANYGNLVPEGGEAGLLDDIPDRYKNQPQHIPPRWQPGTHWDSFTPGEPVEMPRMNSDIDLQEALMERFGSFSIPQDELAVFMQEWNSRPDKTTSAQNDAWRKHQLEQGNARGRGFFMDNGGGNAELMLEQGGMSNMGTMAPEVRDQLTQTAQLNQARDLEQQGGDSALAQGQTAGASGVDTYGEAASGDAAMAQGQDAIGALGGPTSIPSDRAASGTSKGGAFQAGMVEGTNIFGDTREHQRGIPKDISNFDLSQLDFGKDWGVSGGRVTHTPEGKKTTTPTTTPSTVPTNLPSTPEEVETAAGFSEVSGTGGIGRDPLAGRKAYQEAKLKTPDQIKGWNEKALVAFSHMSSGRTDMGFTQMNALAGAQIEVPQNYEVAIDPKTGMPRLSFTGKQTGINSEGLPVRDKSEIHRLSPQDEEYVNSVLERQQNMQDMVADQIDRTLQIETAGKNVSEEFKQTLAFQTDQFTQEKTVWESNNSFKEAALTGIFGEGDTMNTIDGMQLQSSIDKMMADITGTTGEGEEAVLTAEMQRFRDNLLGQFTDPITGAVSDSISKQQFEAEMTGMLNNNPTFAKQQWEARQQQIKMEAMTKAGQVVIDGLQNEDGTLTDLGNQLKAAGMDVTGDVMAMQTLEQQAQKLQEEIALARQSGYTTMTVPLTDKDGNVLYHDGSPMTRHRTVATMERELLEHQKEMMNKAATLDAAKTANRTSELQIAQTSADARLLEAESSKIRSVAAGVAQEEATDLEREKFEARMTDAATLRDAERSGLLDSQNVEADTVANYSTNLAAAIEGATFNEENGKGGTSALRTALNAPIPGMPAGMIWNGTDLVFREGYGGQKIDINTQQQMDRLIPALKQRDRAERVIAGIDKAKIDLAAVEQEASRQQEILTKHLMDADIDSAEEAAIRKHEAEIGQIEMQTKIPKWELMMQAAANPVVMGMMQKSGMLAQLEADLGIEMPNKFSEAATGMAIPNPNEFQTMDSHEKAMAVANYSMSTGGTQEDFFRVIGANAPGQQQRLQYGVL